MHSPFTYFNKIYCINLDHRTDRWQQCEREFAKEDMTVERISAIYGDKEGNNRFIAFNKSQQKAIKKAIDDDAKNALVLEDDVVFKNTMHLHYAMNELPEDWFAFYLGGNILGIDTIPFNRPDKYSAHLYQVRDIWQTQSVAYSNVALHYIHEHFNPENGYNYDEWLRQNVTKQFKCFIIAPQISYQRKSYSDLWMGEANFEHLFQQGNAVLR